MESSHSHSGEPVIRVENVSVRYRVPDQQVASLKEYIIRWVKRQVAYREFLALNDVSFDVHDGEAFGVIGHNGAGKSTLLKLLARVLVPTSGRVFVRGYLAPLLGFGAGFHMELSGRENIFLNGALLGFSHEEMQEKFDRIVEFAELGHFIDAPLRTYSTGMRARLGFAIATDIQPDVLLIDEALSVGDARFRIKSMDRMESFRESGASILLVSHNMNTIQEICNRVAWLDHGKLKLIGDTEEVVEQYQRHQMGKK